jgi:AAA domain
MAKITVEEAKRRRSEREAAARPEQPDRDERPPRQHVNGRLREIAIADWNELGAVVAQDILIGDMLGPEQLGMIYGESGSGKSFLTFDMVAHYALSSEWMGHKVKGGGVLYIAAEGRGAWANRVEAFCRHHKIDEETRAMVPFGFVLESINLGRSGNGDVAAIIRAVERLRQKINREVDLIVVDTMARATPGSNENDAGDMSAFVANMDAIRQQTKATQLIVHHSGKNQALGARGHSSLRAAVDLELEIERSATGRVLKLRKSRDGNDGMQQPFQLLAVEIGRTIDDDQPVTSCVVQQAEAIEPVAKARRPAKSQRSLFTAIDQALDRHGIELQLPDNGPKVKAVNRDYARNGYCQKRADLDQDNARRTFNRDLGKAIEQELILSRELSETVWLFYPTKQ